MGIRKYIFIVFLILTFSSVAQVGINTLTVSDAAALQVNAQRIPTINYGGFLMPVVTEAQQASIPVSTSNNSDDGLMVYVSDPITGKHCWDIYDGEDHIWRSINCQGVTCSSTVLFEEDFNSYSNDTGVSGASSSNGDYPSGVTKWTLTSFQSFGNNTPNLPGTLLNDEDYALVKSGKLEFRDTNGALQFESQQINISGYSDILISMEISESGTLEYVPLHVDDFDCGEDESDYVDIEYSTNGGSTFTEVSNYLSNGTVNHTLADDLLGTVAFSLSGISGTSLVIRVRLQNWADDEYYYLDNILVKCN